MTAPVSPLFAQSSPAIQPEALKNGSVVGALDRGDTYKPAVGVIVTIRETGQTATTDAHGRYRFDDVAPGTYNLIATGAGYSRLRITDAVVRPGGELSIGRARLPELSPNPEPVQLDEYVVNARRPNEIVEMDPYEVREMRPKPFTGANIDLPRTIDDAQPYVILDRKLIEQSGSTDMVDFVRRYVPMNVQKGVARDNVFIGNTPDQSSASNNSSIDLSGLGTNQTLILVNGRPLPGVSILGSNGQLNQADINGIPLSAVDHIEILPASASAIYGGGAVGGVINIVLRQDYVGSEVKVTYENTYKTDSPARTVSFNAGMALEGGRTQVSVSVSYTDQDSLRLRDRANLYQGNRDLAWSRDPALRPFNASNLPLGTTPNIAGMEGYFPDPNTGDYVYYDGSLFGPGTASNTYVPLGYAGGDGLAPFLANAGSFNLETPDTTQGNGVAKGLGSPITARARNEAINFNLSRKFTSNLEIFTQLMGSRSYSFGDYNPGWLDLTISGSSPANPFGVPVRVVASTHSDLPSPDSENRQIQAILGFKLTLGDWTIQGDANYASAQSLFGGGAFSDQLMQADVDSGALDIFRDVLAHPIDLSPYEGSFSGHTNSISSGGALRAAGPIWHLPAGPVTLASGLEYRREQSGDGSYRYAYPNSDFTQINAKRILENLNAYAELTLPVFSKDNSLPALRELDFQLAGRLDRNKSDTRTFQASKVLVSDGITTVVEEIPVGGGFTTYNSHNATAGVRYRPVQDVMLRASLSTAFRPPQFAELQEAIPMFPPELWEFYPGGWLPEFVSDPKRGGEFVQVPSKTGGNPDLKPESSRDYSVGIVFEPTFVPGLRIGLDYARIVKRNNTALLGGQEIVDNEESFPDRVQRGPVAPGDPWGVGPLTFIDNTYLNLSWSENITYNLQINYDFSNRLGHWSLFVTGSSLQHQRYRARADSPIVEQLDQNHLAKFQANGGLSWQRGPWSVGWNTRFYGAYGIDSAYVLAQGGTQVKPQYFHDAFLAYEFPQSGGDIPGLRRLLNRTTIQVGAKNIFNTEPAYDASNTLGFYSTYGDVRMGVYYFSVKRAF